jgi:hypothetical protein
MLHECLEFDDLWERSEIVLISMIRIDQMFKSESLNLIGEAQKTHLVDGREYSSA